MCLLPLIAWLSGDWFVISLITSPLMLITFLGWKYVPESPRWLLSRPNRIQESAQIFRTIAKVNKLPEPTHLEDRLQKINEEILQEKHYGYVSLFMYKGLAWKTFLMTVTSFCSYYTYNQLYYNVDNMGGNTFINFFLISVVEGPASYVGLLFAVSIRRSFRENIYISFASHVIVFCLFDAIS